MNYISNIQLLGLNVKLLLLGLISLSLLFVSPTLHAKDRVVSYNGMELTLTQKKCTDKSILEIMNTVGLKDELKKKIFKGTVKAPSTGETRQFCYVTDPTNADVIFVVDDKGDGGVINVKASGGI